MAPPSGQTKQVCFIFVGTVPHLHNADSLLLFHRCQADGPELLVVHELGEVVDAQAGLGDVDVYVAQLGPFQFFKLCKKTNKQKQIICITVKRQKKILSHLKILGQEEEKLLTRVRLAMSASETPSAALVPARITEGED